MSYTRRTRRNEYYLDVSDFVLTDPRQVVPSPRRTPIQQIHGNDVTTYCSTEVLPLLECNFRLLCPCPPYFRSLPPVMCRSSLKSKVWSFPHTFQPMGPHSTSNFTTSLSKSLKKYISVHRRASRMNFPKAKTHNRIIKFSIKRDNVKLSWSSP